MCGIFAYTGKKPAAPILIDGLKALEYRGYDSAGIYLPESGCVKAVGQVKNLEEKIGANFPGTAGISHTRWATHGVPTEINAHPHADCTESIYVVHNGIVENYKELKDDLIAKGHVFKSATDTEVVSHLIEEKLKIEKDFFEAVKLALADLQGTFGLAIVYKDAPHTLITARRGSPIVVGLGEEENFIASDPSAIVKYTKKVVYLNDNEMGRLTANSFELFDLTGKKLEFTPQIIAWDAEQMQKGGYDHFMLKEIMEGPDTVKKSLQGRIDTNSGKVKLPELDKIKDKLKNIERLIIVGCGTAYYSGVVGEYMLEEFAGIPVEVEIGSEYRYKKPIVPKNTAVLAVSQSGETADTLAAVREGKYQGAVTLSIINTVGSTIARETDAVIHNQIGPEIGVASTKAFISQVTLMALVTLYIGELKGVSKEKTEKLIADLESLPEKIKIVLESAENIKKVAKNYVAFSDFLYIGRKYNYAIAFEGALKLKEISYIHAEGYGAGEMKHGPIAMIDPNFPTLAIAPTDSVYDKMISNVEEIKARSGKVLAVATIGNEKIGKLADDVIFIPAVSEMLSPILTVIPLQLFAYYVGTLKGYNVDRPRNLAKSVTVE